MGGKHENNFDIGQFPQAGVITVSNWTMAADGETYLYFWSDNGFVATDKMMPIEGFRSTEKWTLIAIGKDERAMMMFPGCKVKGFVACSAPQPRSGIYRHLKT